MFMFRNFLSYKLVIFYIPEKNIFSLKIKAPRSQKEINAVLWKRIYLLLINFVCYLFSIKSIGEQFLHQHNNFFSVSIESE